MMSEQDEIRRRIDDLGQWFHNIKLKGVRTAPDHFLGDYPNVKWQRFAHAVPEDLRGMTVLDIGCNGGFYSIEMKRRGADRVVAIDSEPMYLGQARFAAEMSGAEIEFREMSVYDLGRLGERFDLVIFMGVLYHLRHPLLALDLIHEHAARDLLLFQSMMRGSQEVEPLEENYPITETGIFAKPGYPKMHFVERRYSNDDSNWWIPNRACVEAMLRDSGFEIEQRAEEEVYLCRRTERRTPGVAAVYPARGQQ
ncbi:TIGR04290 family methyltransferase [Skermanella pratensis]|uniref:TIGR04290 family methyltransferase n=1 Tax=Skermanella pratensis TaxID=2233999 RepID=UPI0013014CA9|nr:TIGR04290 family methyltransferase [Skermanella pratensis]